MPGLTLAHKQTGLRHEMVLWFRRRAGAFTGYVVAETPRPSIDRPSLSYRDLSLGGGGGTSIGIATGLGPRPAPFYLALTAARSSGTEWLWLWLPTCHQLCVRFFGAREEAIRLGLRNSIFREMTARGPDFGRPHAFQNPALPLVSGGP